MDEFHNNCAEWKKLTKKLYGLSFNLYKIIENTNQLLSSEYLCLSQNPSPLQNFLCWKPNAHRLVLENIRKWAFEGD